MSSPEQSIEAVDPLSAYFTTYKSSLDNNVLYNLGDNQNFEPKDTRMVQVHLNQNINTNVKQKTNLFTKNPDKKYEATRQANDNAAIIKIVQDTQDTYDVLANEKAQCNSDSEVRAIKSSENQNIEIKEFIGNPSSNQKLSINRTIHPLTPPSSPGKTIESPRASGSILAIPILGEPASCLIPLHSTPCLSMLEKQSISTQINSVVLETNSQGY